MRQDSSYSEAAVLFLTLIELEKAPLIWYFWKQVVTNTRN